MAEEEMQTPEASQDAETQPTGKEIFCAVSKQMVPLEETIEIERKPGEILRIHKKYKKYED